MLGCFSEAQIESEVPLGTGFRRRSMGTIVLRQSWPGAVLIAAVALAVVFVSHKLAFSQFSPPARSEYELSQSISVDEASSPVKIQLEQARRAIQAKQWDVAVEILRRVSDMSPDVLVDMTGELENVPARYVGLRRYCQSLLARLPPEALSEYRAQLDPACRVWFEQGKRELDERPLRRIIDSALVSSWADDALWLLGELRLQQGDPAGARAYWERLIPVEERSRYPTWLGVVESDYAPAEVRARLILASILQGDRRRVAEELKAFAELHPDAQARFGGRDTNLLQALRELAAESAKWAAPPRGPDWPTFAGNNARNRKIAGDIDFGAILWQLPLREPPSSEFTIWQPPLALEGSGETRHAPLSYYPTVIDNLVIAANHAELYVVELESGRPAWSSQAIVYNESRPDEVLWRLPNNTIGIPRYTLSSDQQRVYTVMGRLVTAAPQSNDPPSNSAPSRLMCFDLKGQGRLLWTAEPPRRGWDFDGAPLAHKHYVYAVLRDPGPPPGLHVGAYTAATGELQWRKFICTADSPGRGMLHECTYSLLTCDGRTLYLNTNMGAVAALDTTSGTIRWIATYPRALEGDLARPPAWFHRSPNPCLVEGGRLYVAPNDSPEVFALDSQSGRLLWQSGTVTSQVRHLLGVVDDMLIATGDSVYWIETSGPRAGHIAARWPEGNETLGYGRGLLADDVLYWPTREAIFALDAHTGLPRQQFLLWPKGAGGGNLVAVGEFVIIAGPDRLTAFRHTGSVGKSRQHAPQSAESGERGE